MKLFSDPHILRQCGRPLLTRFFERFTHLLPYKHFLPNPRLDNDAYFDSLAQILECTSELPDGLFQALLEIEALAAPENRTRLESALGSDPQDPDATPLSQAIRAWLGYDPIIPWTSLGGYMLRVVTPNVTGATSKVPNVYAGCYGVTGAGPQERVCPQPVPSAFGLGVDLTKSE